MKAMTKKMGAIVLALALCLSLCCTALAAETQTYSSSTDEKFTIEINPAYSEETYTAYKIFDVTYSDPDENGAVSYSYTIDSSSAWYAQVAAATEVFVLTRIGESTVYNVTLVEGVEDEAVIAVFNSIPEKAVVAAEEKAAKATNEDGSSGTTTVTLDVTESGAGYYYITTTLGTVVTIDTTNPTAAVKDKNTPPTLEKKVDLVDEESVNNHVEVNYEFTIDNVHGINHLVLEDAMQITDEGVSYTFDPSSLTVQLIDGGDPQTLTLNTDYTVLWDEATGDDCDFHVVFTVDGVDYDFSSCSDDAYVYVTVNCALDADDAYFYEDEVEIPNHAMVTYGNGGNTVWDVADIYEYAFHIYKYTGDIEEEGGSTPLADAHFSLTNNNTESEDYGMTAYFEVNSETGDYMLEGWIDNVEEIPEGYTADLVSGAAGNIKIDGLAEGSYILTETQAPDGYNKLTSPITVTITVDDTDPSIFYLTVDGTEITGHTVNVENNGGSELPSTGGIGTTIFYIIGGVLVAGAVVVLITRRRMSSEG